LKNQQRQQQYEEIFGKPKAISQSGGAQATQSSPQDLTQLSEEQLIKGLSLPDIRPSFQAELDRRYQKEKLEQNEHIESSRRKASRAGKVLDRADELTYELPALEASLSQMVDAIQTGDLGFWSFNNLADITGIEGFRDPKGAQFKTAAKEFLIGGLSRIKGRPNQWIEQQVLDSAAKIGRDQASNLISTRALQNEVDLKKEFV